MAVSSSKAIMATMQSSRHLTWGLCLLLAGAVLVAGTNKSCVPTSAAFLPSGSLSLVFRTHIAWPEDAARTAIGQGWQSLRDC